MSLSRFRSFVKILLIVENDCSASAELDGNSDNLIAASLRFGNITDSLGFMSELIGSRHCHLAVLLVKWDLLNPILNDY